MAARAGAGGRPRRPVAAALGKSTSTAYNLLASLVDEGIAVRRPRQRLRARPRLPAGHRRRRPSCTTSRRWSTTCSRARTSARISRCRTAATCAWWPSAACRACRRSRAWARRSATTPTRSPSARSCSPSRPTTPSSATWPPACGPSRPHHHPARRAAGRAAGRSAAPASPLDREEFGEDLCCIAAPILDDRHRFLGAVGISMTRRAFDDEHAALEETLRDVARFQPSAENDGVLEPDSGPHLASAGESTVR